MGAGRGFTESDFRFALTEAKGVMARAAEILDCSVPTIVAGVKKYPALKDLTIRRGKRAPNKRPHPDKIIIKDEDMVAALIANGGLLTHAAKQLGVASSTFLRRFNEKPAFKRIVEMCREAVLDDAEKGLHEKVVQEKDLDAIKFVLTSIGGARGYGRSDGVDREAAMRAVLDLQKVRQFLYPAERSPSTNTESVEDHTDLDSLT